MTKTKSLLRDGPIGPRLPLPDRVIRFIERYCVHPDGRWIGLPFRLMPWQRDLIMRLFAEDAEGLRRHTWAYIEIPKKNGKTTLAAAIGLYLLIADEEPSPLVVCAAASEDQADLVFGAAKRMCELSHPLSQVTERFDQEILVPSKPGARMRRLAAVAGANDGQNIYAAILDELHEWVGPRLEQTWTVLTNSVGARRRPLVLQITTAGWDEDSLAGRQRSYGERVAAGEVDDPRYFFCRHAAKDGADHRDPVTWREANPSFGVTVDEEFFKDQLTKKPEAVFRRYFLSQWTATEQTWLPAGAWDACRSDLDLDPALPTHVGIDVGLKHDSSAVVIAQRRGDRTVIRARIWENPHREGTHRHVAWRLDIAEVEKFLVDLFTRFPTPTVEIDGELRPGPEFCYDPHFFERSAQALEGQGLAMVEFPQTDARMIPASQTFYDLIVENAIAHDGDRALKRHVLNVVAEERSRGWRMSKPRGSKKKIDAAIAAAIAAYRAQHPPAAPAGSKYESQGLLLI